MISCVVIHDFAATVERVHNPTLRSLPLVIVSNARQPKVVATSALSRQAGIQTTMTLKEAKLLCPQVQVLTVRHDTYRRACYDITELLLNFANKVEPEYQATTTAFYLDTTDTLEQIQQAVKLYLGITPSIGIAANKFTARVVGAYAAFSQNNIRQIPAGSEATQLAIYPVQLLPLDKDMQRRLPLLGIRTLGQYASLPRHAVLEQFGTHGRWLHDLANGKDIRPIVAYHPPLKLCQSMPFEDAVTNYEMIKPALRRLATLLCHQLNDRAAHNLALILRLENRKVIEEHQQPPEPISSLPVLIRHLDTLLCRRPLDSGIVGCEIRLTNIKERQPVQLSLFDAVQEDQSLSDVLDRLQARHGTADFLHIVLQPTPPYYVPEREFEVTKIGVA